MAFNTPLTKTENYVFGRGVCYFAPFDDDGRPMGERDMGNAPGVALTIESEKADHFSSRSGLRKKDLSVTISVAFTGKVTVEDMSPENQAIVIAGTTRTISQTATPVTNERIYNAQSGREYQLGATEGNPSGVRGVSSVTVGLYELVNAAARTNTTPYVEGDIFKSTTNVFIVTAGGTTAGSAPTFNTAAVGDSTTDGGATVKFIGTTSSYTVSTDYQLSSESARIGIKPGAALGAACDLFYSTKGSYPSLNVGYTPAANSRQQIVSTGAASIAGQFRFIADNAVGDNRDLFISSCTISASGDLTFITENEAASVELELGVNERDSSTPQIIIDGRPVT